MFKKLKQLFKVAQPIEPKPQFRVVNNGATNIVIKPELVKENLSKEDATYYNRMYLMPHGKHQVMTNFEHFVYIEPIIDGRYFWFENEIDRRAMERHDAFYNAYIKKVSESLTKEPIQIVKPNEIDKKDPENRRNKELWWRRKRLNTMLGKAFRRIRRDGYVVYYPVKQSWPDYHTRGAYYVFSDKELTETKWDEFGHPIEWEVHLALKNGAGAVLMTDPKFGRPRAFERLISIDEVVYFDPHHNQDYIPEPAGSEFWDDLVDYHYIKEAVKSFDQRLGNGFMMITVPMELWANSDAMDKLEEKMKNVRTEKGLIIPSGSKTGGSNPPEFNWMGMQGVQVDFVGHLEKYEDGIAAGMRFPKRWLIGDQEGAMESSGKDKLQVHIRLSEIFNKYKDFVKAVLKYHGQIGAFDEVDILPGFKLDLSDQEKAEMDLVKTQNIAGKIWLTVDEQRDLDDPTLGHIEGGDQLFAEQDNDAANDQETEKVKGNNVSQGMSKSETKADSIDILVDVFTNKEISVRQLARMLDVSPTTVSKIRSKFDTDLLPKEKIDELLIKEDSVQISENIYEYSGIVLRPQRKYYQQYDTHCVLPMDEITRIFKDETYPKEFRIGVTKQDDHSSKIKSEVLETNSIGTVKYLELTDEGIFGKVRIDLTKTDKVIGDSNWIRDKTANGETIPLSVARWTVDKPFGSDMKEGKIDVRSYVATRKPRNKEIGVK